MSESLHSTPEQPSEQSASPEQPGARVAAVRQLHRPVITAWRISSAISTVIWAAVLHVASILIPAPFALPLRLAVAVIVAGGVISIIFYAPARWRRWTFEVGAHDLRLRHGVFWRTESVVPHVRIQHVDTQHGPIDRRLGLATVIVYTAGRVGGSLPIPGLAIAEAEALRDQLATLSGSDDAV